MTKESRLSSVEFQRLCADVVRDRKQIHAFNPGLSELDALYWMILCSLWSLLSLDEDDSGSVTPTDYRQAIISVLEARRLDNFDVAPMLDQLAYSLRSVE